MNPPSASTNPVSLRWGFIGSGRIASALVGGIIRAGVAPPDRIAASDLHPAAREQIAREVGIAVYPANAPVI